MVFVVAGASRRRRPVTLGIGLTPYVIASEVITKRGNLMLSFERPEEVDPPRLAELVDARRGTITIQP